MQFVELFFAAIVFIIVWLFGSLVLWLAGKLVSGYNAKFTDALAISLLGAIINWGISWVMDNFVASLLAPLGLVGMIIGLVVPLLIVLIVYILLIMHFFDTGFLGAFAVGILYLIFMIIILIVLGIFAVIIIGLLLLIFP